MLKLTHGTASLATIALVLATAASGVGCAANPSSGNNGGGGGDQSGATGGNGNPPPSGSGGTVGGNGSGGAPSNPNGFDNGNLFQDAGPPKAPPMDASTGGDASKGAETGGGIGMAVKMFPTLNITLSFTQKGADVTMVATHKGCGSFMIQIHDGFSCDNTMTQGGVWDGKRGDGITGNTVCDAQQNGTLTYTRSGADPTLAWTVGDHNAKTDITYHPIFVDGHCVTFF